MKKTIAILGLFLCMAGFYSCGMKECRCYTTNVIIQSDTLVKNETDTVSNFTRGECEDFNKEEVLTMDSTTFVHHSIICMEE